MTTPVGQDPTIQGVKKWVDLFQKPQKTENPLSPELLNRILSWIDGVPSAKRTNKRF